MSVQRRILRDARRVVGWAAPTDFAGVYVQGAGYIWPAWGRPSRSGRRPLLYEAWPIDGRPSRFCRTAGEAARYLAEVL